VHSYLHCKYRHNLPCVLIVRVFGLPVLANCNSDKEKNVYRIFLCLPKNRLSYRLPNNAITGHEVEDVEQGQGLELCVNIAMDNSLLSVKPQIL